MRSRTPDSDTEAAAEPLFILLILFEVMYSIPYSFDTTVKIFKNITYF